MAGVCQATNPTLKCGSPEEREEETDHDNEENFLFTCEMITSLCKTNVFPTNMFNGLVHLNNRHPN